MALSAREGNSAQRGTSGVARAGLDPGCLFRDAVWMTCHSGLSGAKVTRTRVSGHYFVPEGLQFEDGGDESTPRELGV